MLPSGMRRRGARTGFALAVAVLSGACGGAAQTGDQQPAQTPAVSLTAEVKQSRQDQTKGEVRVGVGNDGEVPVTVLAVQLVASPFPTARAETEAQLGPGQRVDVRLPHGEPACPDGPNPAASELAVDQPAAEVTVRPQGGEPTTVTVELPARGSTLDALLQQLCGQQAVARVVEVGFGPEWQPVPDATTMRGVLEISRVDGADAGPEVTLVALNGSVMLGLRPLPAPADPLASLSPGEPTLRLPVEVGAARCDPHALLESKKTYVFSLWFSLDGGPEIYTTVEPRGAVRRLMGDLLAASCSGVG